MNKEISMFYNGEWVVSKSGHKFDVLNPWNQEHLLTIVEPAKEEIDMAIANSVATFKKQRLSSDHRFEILSNVAKILKARHREFAEIISKDCGKPICDSESEVLRAIQTFQISAEEAKRIQGYTEQLAPAVGSDFSLGMTIREPIGVVCAITPFNFPLNLAAHKIAPAIAAGNTVIFKPAEQVTRTAEALVNAMTEAGLPAGFLNLIAGTGKRVGDLLLEDQRIQFYSFTGSEKVGQHIKEKSGLRRVALELGSNAPNIVHHDADVDLAAKLLVKAAFAFSGQVCISAQRIYVHSSVADTFTNKFLALTSQLQMGDPLLETTDIGPIINEQQAARIETWIQEAVASGAQILAGGKRDGSFISPTVIKNPDPACKIMCEEVFGPVINILTYDGLDELIENVNNSRYGLQAGIFTSNLNTAFYLARECDFGGININNASSSRADSMPYGGVKNSGIGREGPKFAIEDMTEIKVITFNTKNL